jgi:GR25 family glycosyltransferase involved in LPS biosynthesis
VRLEGGAGGSRRAQFFNLAGRCNRYTSSVHVIAISMGDPDRLASLEKQADAIGLQISIVPGVDLSRIPKSELLKLTRPWLTRILLGRSLTLGEVGCATAHLRAQASLMDRSDEWLCVLEDDVLLSDSVKLTLSALSQMHFAQPVVVLLGTFARSVPCVPEEVIELPGTQVRLVRVRWLPAGALAYCINRAASRDVLKHLGPIVETADWPSWMSRVTFYVCAPEVARSSDAPSGISGRSASLSQFRRRLAWATRPFGILVAPQLAQNYDRASLFHNLVLAPLSTSEMLPWARRDRRD